MKKTYICPRCHNTIHYRTKDTIISSPFTKCPRCYTDIIDPACSEWVSLDFISKMWGYILYAFKSIIVAVLVVSLLQLIGVDYNPVGFVIISSLTSLPMFILFVFRMSKSIKESKQRTQSKEYLDKYILNGYRVPKRVYKKSK